MTLYPYLILISIFMDFCVLNVYFNVCFCVLNVYFNVYFCVLNVYLMFFFVF